MSVIYRTPPYCRNASTISWKTVKRGDIVDMGDQIFWSVDYQMWCDESETLFSKNCSEIRQAVSPSWQEFFEADQASHPAKPKFYAITDIATGLPLPGRQTTAQGMQLNIGTGQFSSGGPVIEL